MKKLKHLHIHSDHGCYFPKGNLLDYNSNLHKLDTFSRLYVSPWKRLEESLKRIPNIRQLEIKVSKFTTTMVSLDSLNQLESLESLKVSTGFEFEQEIEYCFPSTLKKLTLEHLSLPWSKISLIEELPNLEVLKLLGGSFQGRRWDMKGGGFPRLRVLWFKYLDLVEWIDTDCDGDCIPCLEKLVLVGSSDLKKVPSCLMSIPTLEMIKVWAREGDKKSRFLVSLVRRIEQEQQSNGNKNLKILIDLW
ncbi:hypothetical protein ACH5RR_028417 [Cinchona calisaya]|uniref:Uncharacterized protein n=1 Tax=Cinchona calisaya TaxID=153742 RepID=A0ABD2YNQ1_9GENT